MAVVVNSVSPNDDTRIVWGVRNGMHSVNAGVALIPGSSLLGAEGSSHDNCQYLVVYYQDNLDIRT
jgi:hypothetical protein